MLSAPDFKQKQIALAFLSRGDKLSFKNDNIVIKDCDGITKHQSTCYRLFTLFVVGHACITTGLLQRSKKFGFNLILMGHNLNTYGQFNYKTEGNVLLRQKQYNRQGLAIAQHLVNNKIEQQKTALKQIRQKDQQLKTSIKQLQDYQNKVQTKATDLYSLLGIEGVASKVYFQNMFAQFDWHGRKPRAKRDIINTLLDIGYTLLFNLMEGLLNQYGFDTYQGVYHQNFYQRKSLVCDLVEPFRVIIDTRIRKAYNTGQINEEDFDIMQGQYRLFGANSKKYLAFLLESLMEHKQAMFLYVQTYYRCFIRDKEVSDYPLFNKFKE